MKTTYFYDLGKMSYRDAWKRQTQFMDMIIQQKKNGLPTDNVLLFVEHPNVYTLGKSGDEVNMLINSIQLQAKNVDFIHTDRGGDITYHGEGQLVVYPILDLENFGMGVKTYINSLEEVIIEAIKKYGIAGERLEKATGVWIEPHTTNARKIAAIGVKCSRYVSMHGLALNVNTDLDYFNYINPCGFKDKGVTSIAKELGKTIDFEGVKEIMKAAFIEVFDMDMKYKS